FISSADWMDRNFFRRVELGVPVLDRSLKKRVISEAFTFALRDNQLAWKANSDGTYSRIRSRRTAFNLHQFLMHRLGGV
ncbi:MAG TPA: RNA degradosome polyphosphate kinase, partial [Alcaligenes sp.]|nr:RNA degradosome polyphosphate kinase [Alcaligenes sp.]